MPDGDLAGVPAVIDKDLASSLLASDLGADLLLITTGVEKVALNFGTPQQRWADRLKLSEAKAYLAAGTHFAKGSMAPKIQAMIEYLERGGTEGIITDTANVDRALSGETRNPDHPGLSRGQSGRWLPEPGRGRPPAPGEGAPARIAGGR